MKITIDNQEFEKITDNSNHCDDVFYQGNWYKPVKEVLFITEDGKEACVGQECHGVYIPNNTYYSTFIWMERNHFGKNSLDKDVKYFSTKEAAEEYIQKNKPKEWEILSFKNEGTIYGVVDNKPFTGELLQYHLNNKDTFIFSIKRLSE